MFREIRLTSFFAAFGFAATAGLMPAATAAQEASKYDAPLILAQADQIDDATIEAFAAAQLRLAEVEAFYAARYEAADTNEERQQISEAATEEMMEAVEATPGITLDEYNAVVEAANQDPTLVQRINEAIAEMAS